ncbi:TlpA family protein disulfide reductase [Pedobacter sp.]|uniref:TlpA family protein disulfide reductase n=1 Tax=Pedobacter sp. TaxID=1411316 RepID=UPI00396CBE61
MDIYKTRLKIDVLKSFYDQLAPLIKQSNNGQAIARFIGKSEENGSGQIAKDFSGEDPNGKVIKLSDYRGKYVLLDFWGSWCLPCRESVPHLKELFKKYHSKGFEVVAIAVDDKIANWKKAIKIDGTELWSNIMDMPSMNKGEVNTKAIHYQYDVHLFPTKLLIDKNGIILARYNGADPAKDLDKKLAELFGK